MTEGRWEEEMMEAGEYNGGGMLTKRSIDVDLII